MGHDDFDHVHLESKKHTGRWSRASLESPTSSQRGHCLHCARTIHCGPIFSATRAALCLCDIVDVTLDQCGGLSTVRHAQTCVWTDLAGLEGGVRTPALGSGVEGFSVMDRVVRPEVEDFEFGWR